MNVLLPQEALPLLGAHVQQGLYLLEVHEGLPGQMLPSEALLHPLVICRQTQGGWLLCMLE